MSGGLWVALIGVGSLATVIVGAFGVLYRVEARARHLRHGDDRNEQVRHIKQWRDGVAAYLHTQNRGSIQAEPWYPSLRQYLTDDELRSTADGHAPVAITTVQGAIERMAREWKVP